MKVTNKQDRQEPAVTVSYADRKSAAEGAREHGQKDAGARQGARPARGPPPALEESWH